MKLRWMARSLFWKLAMVSLLGGAEVKWGAINRQSAEWYASEEARAIATSVVEYQRESGGWTKNRDMRQPPSLDYRESQNKEDQLSTIDNGGTTTQLEYLARVLTAADNPGLRAAFDRGFEYLLAAQYQNGGWPQFYPLRQGYYTHITYNDNAMANVLTLLRSMAAARAPYAFVDASQRARAQAAVERGIACILQTQIKQHGRLTVWCAQHDETTLAPVWARNFEPPSLSAMESVGLVRFLLGVETPTPEIVAAVEGAVTWLQAAEIKGLRLEDFTGADGKRDKRAVADPAAGPLWARFYELDSNRPVFAGRDKIIRYDYNEIERERRVGYGYLGDWPVSLLSRDYPRWRAKHKLP